MVGFDCADICDFVFDSVRYVPQPVLVDAKNGYFKILSKYANRSIKIMYSPKYEQVMILKD